MILVITLILTILYGIFLAWCNYHWGKIENTSEMIIGDASIKVAVIVPVRNEAKNISSFIESFLSQNYPKENCELIICDDHSTDNTFVIAQSTLKSKNILNGCVIESTGKYKKGAIEHAISKTNAELIITADCDITAGREWISSIVAAFVRSNAYMLCCPVNIKSGDYIIETTQSIEFAGLIGIGAAGIQAHQPIMCNGANLAFVRKIFNEVGGYSNSKSESGDDTQLMLKIDRKHPGRIAFVKDSRAVVFIHAISEFSELWNQRKRWASKIPLTLSAFTISIAILAWLVHSFLLIHLLFGFRQASFLVLLLPWMIKIAAEMKFLKSINSFYCEKTPFWLIIGIQPFYCLYVVATGIISPFAKFKWKGRELR